MYLLAQHISKHFIKNQKVPSTIQIRWHAVRGILTVVNDNFQLLAGKQILIRCSMVKCVTGSADNGICTNVSSNFSFSGSVYILYDIIWKGRTNRKVIRRFLDFGNNFFVLYL
mmetsp:Transcript_47878/g.48287  ORF Transcript_47878/g.48287 Transcript_47878/m.48287 type:complete len:113 (-) Transcript_47878:93-431(-)